MDLAQITIASLCILMQKCDFTTTFLSKKNKKKHRTSSITLIICTLQYSFFYKN